MSYVVMGVSGCGKTSIGQGVADALRMDFVEGDALHPPANIEKMSRGIPLTDEDRFPWLDRIGRAIGEGRGVVVSCSALKQIYRDRLRGFAAGQLIFVYLKGTEDLLLQRLTARKGHFMPASLLQSQLAALEDPMGEGGVVAVDISGSVPEIIAASLEAIRNLHG
jgi:gluconokinase